MYAHLDLDEFFVAVERLANPALKGLPVVVGGSPTGRGVVACASYEARAFGVRSAMPMREALRRCPHLTIVNHGHGRYSHHSGIVAELLEHYIPVVNQASIDEFYLDLNGLTRLYGDVERLMADLRLDLLRITALPMSVGMARLPYLAKMASKAAKPNGFFVVRPQDEHSFLDPQPVRRLPGVGPKLEGTLTRRGVHTIGDLAHMDETLVTTLLGKPGYHAWRKARADWPSSSLDWSDDTQKQLSAETTFQQDLDDPFLLELSLRRLIEKAAFRLRRKQLAAGRVTVKLRYTDFATRSRGRVIQPTEVDFQLYRVAKDLLHALHTRRVRVRLLGIQFSQLKPGGDTVFAFDDEARPKQLVHAVDALRKRYQDRGLVKLGTFWDDSRRAG